MNIRGASLYRQAAGSGLRRAGTAQARQRPSGAQARGKTGKAAPRDKVTISKEGLAAQKKAAQQRAVGKGAAAQGARGAKPAAQGMRGRKQGPGQPQMGPPKGVNTGATVQFSERSGVCFVTKG